MPSVNEYAATLHKQFDSAYSLAWSHSLLSHLRQKEIYDKKVHRKPYKKGDLVWLHFPLSKRRINKKLYRPWSGAYKVVKKLSNANYRIEQVQGRKNRKIVHFDQLKLCPANIHQNEELISEQGSTDSQNLPPEDMQHTESLPVGHHLQIMDYDDEEILNETDIATTTSILPSAVPSRGAPSSRYPRREHQPPTRFNDFVAINCVED